MLVVGLAVVFIALSAATALADYSNGEPWAAWDATYNAGITGSSIASETPHRDYRTATIKCDTCHAVHGAVATTSAAGSEMLLRSTVAESCTYCHITTSIGGIQLYGGDPTNWSSADTTWAHNAVGSAGFGTLPCTKCHAVHGAGTLTAPSVASKILLTPTSPDPDVPVAYRGAAASRNQAVTYFCTDCHLYYNAAYDGDSHVMTNNVSSYANPARGATVPNQVAWAGSSTCRSCHDAGAQDGTGFVTDSFPHYTPNNPRFLRFGASVAASETLVPRNRADYDGACLKCHRNGTGNGVGLDF
jgi:hypothetical protein